MQHTLRKLRLTPVEIAYETMRLKTSVTISSLDHPSVSSKCDENREAK
jgi:hypothetical protein